MEQTCKKCEETKPISLFYKSNSYKSGYMSKCKQCQNKMTAEYSKANPDLRKTISRRFYANNKEDYARRAKEARRLKPEMFNALNREYQARKSNAVPVWLTGGQRAEIQAIYAHARDCQVVTGEAYHVDHIVPLCGKTICGLHVPWNLQVLPADLNLQKSNRYDQEENYR